MKMFFAFTLRALTKGSSHQQFYLDARELKSPCSVQNRATRLEPSPVVISKEASDAPAGRGSSSVDPAPLFSLLHCFIGQSPT
jgi:hypothetical protein